MNWSRLLAVVAVLAAAPAAAQPYPVEGYYGGIISPRDVMRTVAGMGLQPASEPHLRGHVWVVRGMGREGTMVRVVIDSHTGRVVDMRAVSRPGPYRPGPGYEAGPYQPDPRYVAREDYGPGAYPPSPRAGEAYRAPAYGGPGGAADDDDDDYGDAPPRQPNGYVPPHSAYPPANEPRFSAQPETKRLAAKPNAVPLPKARPDTIQGNVKADTAKTNEAGKDAAVKSDKPDAKSDMAKQEEPKQEEITKDAAKKDEPKKDEPQQAKAPLTSPKDPETTAAIAAEHKKAQSQPKKETLPPVQPLE